MEITELQKINGCDDKAIQYSPKQNGIQKKKTVTCTRKLQHHHRYFKIEAANYKEIKEEEEVNNDYKSNKLDNTENYKENEQEVEKMKNMSQQKILQTR